MKKWRFRSLGVAVPEAYGGLGMGFVSMLVCDYISGATGSFSTAFGAHTGIGTAINFIWY
jgi:alkylation response protein AidB-like acyl-CoA dehydrogenase